MISGCAATGGVCSGARRIGLSPKDTTDTKRDVTASNEYYEKQGCFTAPNEVSPTDKLLNLFKPAP